MILPPLLLTLPLYFQYKTLFEKLRIQFFPATFSTLKLDIPVIYSAICFLELRPKELKTWDLRH